MTRRFAIRFADNTVVEGGGPDDELVPVTIMVSRDWLSAPSDRVLGVIVETNQSRQVLRGAKSELGRKLFGTEFYYPVEDGEYGFSDDLGAWLRKMNGTIKRGEYVSSKVMEEFWSWANNYTGISR